MTPVKLMLDAVIAVITKEEKVLIIQRAPVSRGNEFKKTASPKSKIRKYFRDFSTVSA